MRSTAAIVLFSVYLTAAPAMAERAQVWGRSVSVVSRADATARVERVARAALEDRGLKVGALAVKVGKRVYPLGYPLFPHQASKRYAVPYREYRVVASVKDKTGKKQTLKLTGRTIADPSYEYGTVEFYGSGGSSWRKPDWTPQLFEKRYGFLQPAGWTAQARSVERSEPVGGSDVMALFSPWYWAGVASSGFPLTPPPLAHAVGKAFDEAGRDMAGGMDPQRAMGKVLMRGHAARLRMQGLQGGAALLRQGADRL